ncbi:MAG: gamma-glutamyltransferase [Acetobacter sp.]
MAARFNKHRSVLSRTGLSGRSRAAAFALALTGTLAACGGPKEQVSQPAVSGFVGEVAADEPRAALVARDILAKGGNAADAAAALGLALSVSLPSRASLGGGGACLAWRPGEAAGQAFVFLPQGPSQPEAGADRPASAPLLARGLFLMQMRYGSVDFADLIVPARNMASHGVPVGGLLAADLAAVQTSLLADDKVRAVFGNSTGHALTTDDVLVQTRLSGALERLRIAGVGDLYTGALAQTFVDGAQAAGGGLSRADMRNNVPVAETPLTVHANGVDISFLPPPADGGLGMAASYLAGGRGGEHAVAAWRARQTGRGSSVSVADAQALLNSGGLSSGGALPALPASTSFVVTDRQGETVACALSMNNLFGTGRIAGSTGIVLGASPTQRPQPLLAAGIAHQGRDEFRAAAVASGQNVAADTAAIAMRAALAGVRPQVTNGNGRANFVSCPGGLPSGAGRCFGWTDPRGSGLAVGYTPVTH